MSYLNPRSPEERQQNDYADTWIKYFLVHACCPRIGLKSYWMLSRANLPKWWYERHQANPIPAFVPLYITLPVIENEPCLSFWPFPSGLMRSQTWPGSLRSWQVGLGFCPRDCCFPRLHKKTVVLMYVLVLPAPFILTVTGMVVWPVDFPSQLFSNKKTNDKTHHTKANSIFWSLCRLCLNPWPLGKRLHVF